MNYLTLTPSPIKCQQQQTLLSPVSVSDNRSSPQIQATEVLPIIISSQTDINVALTEKTVDYLDKKTDLGFFFLERHQKKNHPWFQADIWQKPAMIRTQNSHK